MQSVRKEIYKSSHVRTHIREVHNGARNHHCTECNYKAKTELRLREHVKAVHDEQAEKLQLQCPHCEHKAKADSSLRYHVSRIHYKVRPYKCTQCDFGGRSNQDLDHHMKRKHPTVNDEKYECSACDYVALIRKTLHQHVKAVHAKIKDQLCPQCMSTSYPRCLKEHIKKILTNDSL